MKVEVRCPAGGKLLAKTVLTGEYRMEGVLLEVVCRACRDAERDRGVHASRVVHRFTVEGSLVETEVR